MNSENAINALCILDEGDLETVVLDYLTRHQVNYRQLHHIPENPDPEWDQQWDLILLDADLEGGDLLAFFRQCSHRLHPVPVVAFHQGARGSRDTALIRMGAFDAFPKDIGRWNTEVYLNRAVSQARLVKRLLSQSRTDHVTGLYNQRFLYESLEREIRRGDRTGEPLSIALLDVDNFKNFNDTHGHLAGDETLRRIAEVLTGSIRTGTDSAYRYGGDEFMLILPNTDRENAMSSLERILHQVHAVSRSDLTFSIGLATMVRRIDVQEFIRAADIAMYEAKNDGGGRIVTVLCDERTIQDSLFQEL